MLHASKRSSCAPTDVMPSTISSASVPRVSFASSGTGWIAAWGSVCAIAAPATPPVAAIQAARIGAKTLLVEHGSQLGGTMTVGGVAFPGLFHAWGKQVIGGIGWDLVRQTVELDGGRLPEPDEGAERESD